MSKRDENEKNDFHRNTRVAQGHVERTPCMFTAMWVNFCDLDCDLKMVVSCWWWWASTAICLTKRPEHTNVSLQLVFRDFRDFCQKFHLKLIHEPMCAWCVWYQNGSCVQAAWKLRGLRGHKTDVRASCMQVAWPAWPQKCTCVQAAWPAWLQKCTCVQAAWHQKCKMRETCTSCMAILGQELGNSAWKVSRLGSKCRVWARFRR